MPIVRVVEDHVRRISAEVSVKTWEVRSATHHERAFEAETGKRMSYQIKGDLSSDKANQQKQSTSLL